MVRVEGGYEDAVRLAARAATEPGTALVEDTALDDGPAEEIGGSAAWVVEGYSTLFREVDEQAPAPLDVVIVPVGVGSLAAATVRWAAHRQPARPTSHTGPQKPLDLSKASGLIIFLGR